MKIGKFKINNTRLVRAISQIIFFILLPAIFISTFSGIKAIYSTIINGSFDFAALFPQLIEAIAIIPLTILVGRFFCGWMCAFGSIGDFMNFLSRKITHRKFHINAKADAVLKYLKYAVLLFIFIAVLTCGLNIPSNISPWDAFGMIFTPGKLPDFEYIVSNFLPGLIILILILAASFFYERFFCRYLCPMGAIFALISKLKLTSIIKPKKDCGPCRACSMKCPMGIDLSKKDSSKSGECINCFECVNICPKNNAKYAISGNDIKPMIAGTVAVGAMAGIYYAGTFTSNIVMANAAASQTEEIAETDGNTENSGFDINTQTPSENNSSTIENNEQNSNNQNNSSENNSSSKENQSSSSQQTQSSSQNNSAQSTSTYKDGTYEGSGTGFRGGTTTVKVTVKGGKISDVTLVSSEDTPRFIDYTFPEIASEIKNEQSTDVDCVSGATFSSMGIMEAVENALTRAK